MAIIFLFVILLFVLGALHNADQRTPFIIIAAVLFSIFIFIVFFRKFLIRKKVASFINRVIAHDRETIDKAPPSSQAELLALEKSWYDSIGRLKNSALRTSGNPLYVLPWYMVIGESGTGKTSMLKHSGLSSPLSSLNSTPGLPATRNCDWWFFNEAVVLDTAGRYTVPLDQDRDNHEWEQFLKHLSVFRKKEPVNGIVAAIPADKLLDSTPEQLAMQGQLVRSRIDQVMRVLGSSFPVYIMITKMDLVFGMPEFFRALPRSRLGQAMGWCNHDGKSFSGELLNEAVLAVCDNLKQLQFTMLHNENTPEAEILVFPQRFLELSYGLTAFCTAVFSPSVYHLTPLFRGVYFSSALQKIGQGECDESAKNISAHELSGGVFLKDFFSRVLPGDRKFHWYIPLYRQKRAKMVIAALGGWVVLWAVLSLLGWRAFSYTKKTLGTVKELVTTSDTDSSIMVENLRKATGFLSKRNAGIFPFRMGMRQGKEVEKKLKSRYAKAFGRILYEEILPSAEKRILSFPADTMVDSATFTINFLTSMICVARRPENSGMLTGMAQSSAAHLTFIRDGSPGDGTLFARQFADWVTLSKPETVDSLKRSLYALLNLLIEHTGTDLQWCVGFPVHGVENISMKRFWPHASTGPSDKKSMQDANTPIVNGAYTLKGSRRINSFLMRIDSALSDSLSHSDFETKRIDFVKWYGDQYDAQWYAMTVSFLPRIIASISPGTVQPLFRQIASGNDPFIRYLTFMAEQFDSTDMLSDPPLWGTQVVLIRDLDSFTVKKQLRDSTTSTAGKMKNSLFAFFDKIFGNVQNITDENKSFRARKIEHASPGWSSYRRALSELGSFLQRPEGVKNFAPGLFEPNDSTTVLYDNLVQATDMLKQRLFGSAADIAIWETIINGPLVIVRKAAYSDACDRIEELWENNVLSKAARKDPESCMDILFAPDSGLVRKFLEDPFMATFIDGSIKPVVGTDGPIPFSADFISFVEKGMGYSPKDSYAVTITNVPFSVNADAVEKPYQTVLCLHCADGDRVLENFNNNESAEFVYLPLNCGRVSLKLIFPSFKAIKIWEGQWAFPAFLSEFKQSGAKTWNPGDFDDAARARLIKAKCDSVTVSYSFNVSKADEIIGLLKYASCQTPQTVTDSLLQ